MNITIEDISENKIKTFLFWTDYVARIRKNNYDRYNKMLRGIYSPNPYTDWRLYNSWPNCNSTEIYAKQEIKQYSLSEVICIPYESVTYCWGKK